MHEADCEARCSPTAYSANRVRLEVGEAMHILIGKKNTRCFTQKLHDD